MSNVAFNEAQAEYARSMRGFPILEVAKAYVWLTNVVNRRPDDNYSQSHLTIVRDELVRRGYDPEFVTGNGMGLVQYKGRSLTDLPAAGAGAGGGAAGGRRRRRKRKTARRRRRVKSRRRSRRVR